MTEQHQQVFHLPDVGEGLTEAEIVKWLVATGDSVSVNQIIVEIETAKAVVELPCPYAGVIDALHVSEGEIVPVGSPIVTILVTAKAEDREPVLVGYGAKAEHEVRRRPRKSDGQQAAVAATATGTVTAARTKPLVRKLAKELGVQLDSVTPTGIGGVITREDVLGSSQNGHATKQPVTPAGCDDRQPVRGVQRAMADAMVRSAFTAPHVTEWVEVDVSRTLELVARLRIHVAFEGIRVTPLTIVAAAVIQAVKKYPRINSTWLETPEGADILTHHDVHLGIAADTPRGLLVPSVKSAGAMELTELARSIHTLIETARAGRSTPADLTGGTITITNIGVFGVDGGTPIINPGESAILAVGRILDRPWVVDGVVSVRPIMQLSMSFDHRVIDGALGSRALVSMANFLADPAVEMLMGPTTE
ncbi:MAG: branched-chain alpha-keto acid dehydrogenase subunit E2 [Actinobacteria bacterium]|nr:MAG: branched-chain alpha-keto acid dehydrogenase subunit E2 [Actinomycetota bacterium]